MLLKCSSGVESVRLLAVQREGVNLAEQSVPRTLRRALG
jgi:hypothetical protein